MNKIHKSIMNIKVSIGTYQIEGSSVHGNELWHVGVLAVAALNYVGGPRLQRACMIRCITLIKIVKYLDLFQYRNKANGSYSAHS